MHTPKDEVTELLNKLVPLAEKSLKERGEFVPFGGAMLPDGSTIVIGAPDASEHPSPDALVRSMEASFRTAARLGQYKATGVVYDGKTIPPGASEQSEAITVRLDHRDGYSVVIMIPYRRGPGGGILKGGIFAVAGAHGIFPPT